MKSRKSLLTLTVTGIMVLLLCLTGTTLAGPGPNPGSGDTDKIIGPSPKAFLLVGWIPNDDYDETSEGTLEAYVWVNGKVYIGIIDREHPEIAMRSAIESDIPKIKVQISEIIEKASFM